MFKLILNSFKSAIKESICEQINENDFNEVKIWIALKNKYSQFKINLKQQYTVKLFKINMKNYENNVLKYITIFCHLTEKLKILKFNLTD